MSLLDKLAAAVADLAKEAMSEDPGERYRGTFAYKSKPFEETAAGKAALAAGQERIRRRRVRVDEMEAERRADAAYERQRTHDLSPLGRASDAAWLAYLGTPEAQAAYADYGFTVVEPPAVNEHFVFVGRSGSMTGIREEVASVEHGDRVSVSYSEPAWGDGMTRFKWYGADGDFLAAHMAWRFEDPAGRTVALWLDATSPNHYNLDAEEKPILPITALTALSRFLNGYDGGWLDLLAPGQQVTLLALRPGGRAVYDEMRAHFRAAWEAHHG